MLYIFMLILIGFMMFRNIKLMSRYNHNKDYMACYQGMLHEKEGTLDLINNFIANDSSDEFKNKGRILKLFYDIDYGTVENTMKDLDLTDLYYTKGRVDSQKIMLNSESVLWILIVMAKAAKNGQFDVCDALMDKVNQHKALLENYLEYHLIENTYELLKGNEEKPLKFFSDLLAGEYEYAYDKQLIGVYKRFAEAFLAYKGKELGEYETEDLPHFARTGVGSCLMKELGIWDEWKNIGVEEEESEETAEVPEENVIDVEARTVEPEEAPAEETPAEEKSPEDPAFEKIYRIIKESKEN